MTASMDGFASTLASTTATRPMGELLDVVRHVVSQALLDVREAKPETLGAETDMLIHRLRVMGYAVTHIGGDERDG